MNTSKNTSKTVSLTDEQLLNASESELAKMLDAQVAGRKVVKKNTKSAKAQMYSVENFNKFFNCKVEKIDKKERQKIRRTRDRFVNNILFYYGEKQTDELKKEIANFEKFYSTVYVLSDFSLDSLASNNSDKETKVNIRLALQIVKQTKAKK
jgi:hypothetical protein